MTKTAAALRRPGLKTDTRTLVALAAALVVTLWMADQIEMDLFMAFVLWVLIAIRVVSTRTGRPSSGRSSRSPSGRSCCRSSRTPAAASSRTRRRRSRSR